MLTSKLNRFPVKLELPSGADRFCPTFFVILYTFANELSNVRGRKGIKVPDVSWHSGRWSSYELLLTVNHLGIVISFSRKDACSLWQIIFLVRMAKRTTTILLGLFLCIAKSFCEACFQYVLSYFRREERVVIIKLHCFDNGALVFERVIIKFFEPGCLQKSLYIWLFICLPP